MHCSNEDITFLILKTHCSLYLDLSKHVYCRVINIWNSFQVILSMLVAFLYLKNLLTLPPLCMWSLRRPVCLIVVLFSFIGHASVSFGACVSRLLFK